MSAKAQRLEGCTQSLKEGYALLYRDEGYEARNDKDMPHSCTSLQQRMADSHIDCIICIVSRARRTVVFPNSPRHYTTVFPNSPRCFVPSNEVTLLGYAVHLVHR